ncbi:MAG: hypothetical protein NC434_12785 [Ruminococcus sp.]|nr:hypothetical protein [Ruminococcus sp.]
MNVNGIGKQTYYEKANGSKANPKNADGGFYESLSENINEKTENVKAETQKTESELKKENTAFAKNGAVQTAFPYRSTVSKAGTADVQKSQKTGTEAVTEKEARNISYEESDLVKTFVMEGYTLLAQADTDSRKVYVERRREDGTTAGYEVDVDKLDKDTTDPVERMALEAWEQKSEDTKADEEEPLTLAEALLDFYEFIEDRIKNGPPKYMIGNSEFSIAEWDKLLEGIDDQLDAIREELRERIEKMKEEQQKAELLQEVQVLETDVREAENEKIEEELLSSLFQDMSKI